MLSKDIWPVAQFSRLSFDTTCLYVFAENKLISNVKKVSFFFGTPCKCQKVLKPQRPLTKRRADWGRQIKFT